MKTVIFDLDGTLCDIDHRLHHIEGDHKDWDAFYKDCIDDVAKPDVISLYRALATQGYRIIISSGRSEDVVEETRAWLIDHMIIPDELMMRPSKCYVPDNALKKAWLEQGKFGPKEDILCVFEDRDRMVQMWRSCGLTCFQVDQWTEEGEVSYPLKKIELAKNMARYISQTRQDQRFHDWVRQNG